VVIDALRESFTLALEQAVTLLGSLELGLHQPEGLASREDCLPFLSQGVSNSIFTVAHAVLFEGSYSCSRHVDDSLAGPSNVVSVVFGAGQHGRDGDRGGDKKVTVMWNEFEGPLQAVAGVGSWDTAYFWMSSVEIGRRSGAQRPT
jgi:hypothetical protein